MENKELVTSGKMTKELIGGFFLYGIVFGIIYSLLISMIVSSMESMVLVALVTLILQGITIILVWKFSTSSSFKKKTISSADVSKVMKNLVIFTIIISVVSAVYNILNVNSSIEKSINSNYQIKILESKMTYLYDQKEMAEYQLQKEQAIKDIKQQFYVYLIILDIGLTVVYLAVLPLEKKFILKYVK